jgi:predicted short-subunit dehydrogenase-like oxidoreductase (DUF2520 family)
MNLEGVVIVGPGSMGLAIGDALERSGEVRHLTYYGRHPEPPSHPIFLQGRARYVFGVEPLEADTSAVLLAVPDEIVPEMAFTLAAHGRAPSGCAAFHLSGALPTDVLGPLHEEGYAVGALHPLVSVTDRLYGADRLSGAFFAVTGASEALAVARRLTAAIDADVVGVPAARKPLFHAAAALAGGCIVPVLSLSARLMERAGVSGDEVLPVLLSLVRDTTRSVDEEGLAASVPEPLARADLETVSLHLRALDDEDRRLYAVLALEMLRLAGPPIDTVDPDDAGAREAVVELLARHAEMSST